MAVYRGSQREETCFEMSFGAVSDGRVVSFKDIYVICCLIHLFCPETAMSHSLPVCREVKDTLTVWMCSM